MFGKSLTVDDKELKSVASAARIAAAPTYGEVEFIEKLKVGDAEAFEVLVHRYSADIYALLCRLTGDLDEASDLTQDTFLRSLKAVGGFRGDASLKTWLFRIAVNESRNRYRWWKRRHRDHTVSLDHKVGDSDQTVQESIPCAASSPEDDALRRERERLMQSALMELPDVYREAVVLFDIEGFSYEQISQTLEISLGTVKSRIARGREELRKKLKDF